MRLPLFIAGRYFLSKKSQRAINIISMVSVSGVLVGTAALVIVLSVFNGFEDLILRLYNSFDPDVRIEAVKGKNFRLSEFPMEAVKRDPAVTAVMPVIEENALVRYDDRQYIVTLKGVDTSFRSTTGIDTMLLEGNCNIQVGDTDYAVVGAGVAYGLQLGLDNLPNQLEIFAPKNSPGSMLDPEAAFNRRYITPTGIFAVQQEFDTRYIIVPFRFARDIFEYDSLVNSVELSLKKTEDQEAAITRLRTATGERYKVKNRFEQHETIYRIMKSEKWAVYLILTFILIIATFNIIGTLSMLVIEKQKDIAILHSMGADIRMLRKIFLAEGIFINLIGAGIGMLIGLLVCLGQQHFGWIRLSGTGSFVIDAYPVKLLPADFILVFATVTAIGLAASWYPARRMVAQRLDLRTVRNDE